MTGAGIAPPAALIRVLVVARGIEDARLVCARLVAASDGTIHGDAACGLAGARESLAARGYAVLIAIAGRTELTPDEILALAGRVAPGLPVVVLSADDDATVDAVRAGADECLRASEASGPRLLRALRCAAERTGARRLLRAQVVTDALTGLPNRLGLADRLDHAVAVARRTGRSAAVLFLDLDGFKDVNDTAGHDTGDRVLQEIARRLVTRTRDSDTVARLAGDEFVVVMDHLDDPRSAATLARKLLAVAAEPVEIDGRTVSLTASIGISLCPGDGSDPGSLLRNADAAMYAAKADGKHTFRYYSPEMHAAARERLAFEAALGHALDAGEFEVHYHPQWRMATGRPSGCQAVLRWRRPGFGLIDQDDFLPQAEGTSLLAPIGRWVLKTVCADAARMAAAGFELPVSVRVSAAQLGDPGFAGAVTGILRASGLAGHRLTVTVAESVVARLTPGAAAVLRELHAAGIDVAVHAFGTGCSSLGALSTLPISSVTIDRALIAQLPDHPTSAAMACAILAIGQRLGLSIVADGVTSAAQAQFLADYGCDHVLGSYYADPLVLADLLTYLRWACTAVIGSDAPRSAPAPRPRTNRTPGGLPPRPGVPMLPRAPALRPAGRSARGTAGRLRS